MSDAYIPVATLPSGATLGGREIICDGINANRLNDGIPADARIWGIRPPTAAQQAAFTAGMAEADNSTTGGITIGPHLFAVTFAVVIGGVIIAESAPIQSAAFPVANANGQVVLTGIPVSDNAAVNARVLYMSVTGGNILFQVPPVPASGAATVTQGSNTVTQTSGTALTAQMIGMSILVGGVVYAIANIAGNTITLTNPYLGAGGAGVAYAIIHDGAPALLDNTSTALTVDLPDGALSATQLSDTNDLLPVAPFVRSNQNQLALGGQVAYTTGTVAVVNGSHTIAFTGAAVTRAFEDRQIQVAGDSLAYTILFVNEGAQTAILSALYAGATHTGQTFQITSDASTLYLSNPLPGNIEGYGVLAPGSEIIVGGDDQDVINGIGVCRGNWVVGKKQNLYLLTGTGVSLTQDRVSTQIGVASHHTMVQDDHGNCIWYAGASGVYVMSTNQPLCMSRILTPLFQSGVNHARDSWAHAVWYAARKWYILWVTRAGENNITDLCLIADLSQGIENAVWLGPALEQIRWWPQQLPAVNSSTVLFPDGQQRVLVNGYDGNVWLFDVGELDGVANMSCQGTVSATDSATYLECNDSWFQDDTAAATNCQGAVVTMLSGAAAGQRRLVSANAGCRLTIDLTLGGYFSPAPAIGDTLMVGGYGSYWTPPWLTAQSSRTKRWQTVVGQFDNFGADVRLDQTVHRAGRVFSAGRQYLPASQRDRATAALGCTGEILEMKLSTTGPAQPWKLRNLTVTADTGGGIR